MYDMYGNRTRTHTVPTAWPGQCNEEAMPTIKLMKTRRRQPGFESPQNNVQIRLLKPSILTGKLYSKTLNPANQG
ncbi:hypothetical protein RRG08_007200 [Elysia crispata]|uniref:Uncharacterized protein n=1 Tax=Elysia crispata TaxID=231223 RepID=A0AAE1B3I3_9GAST|nr:hypothetical protein RRG08_007200 [Elysia crispata]